MALPRDDRQVHDQGVTAIQCAGDEGRFAGLSRQWVGVVAARRHRLRAHKITMISIYAGALILAGLFTLLPGRLMHDVLFGS